MEDALNLLDGLDVDIPDVPLHVARPQQVGSALHPEFFGPYQLIEMVGAGGVAKVMRARHIHPRYAETTFAIKILHPELSHDPKVIALFRHEAYVLSMLKHPNIVQTFEGGIQDEELFIAMEYIDGRDLENMLTRSQKANISVPVPIAMYIVGEVLKGLSYAHDLCDGDGNRLALTHRDINPANVFLSYDGRVKLGDFGVAQMTAGRAEKSREIAGKVGYFAPEQLAGEPVDQRADLFAMGVLMFETLCNMRLFDGEDADKIMRLNKKAKIPRPTKINPAIPQGLEDLLLKALERKPNDRFANARAMYFALRPFIPEPQGMPLAVAAMVRKVFLREHIQELQLREGLAGSSPSRGSGQRVVVLSEDERAHAAFTELLSSRGYRVDIATRIDDLANMVLGAHAPNVVLADVGLSSFNPEFFVRALAPAQQTIPVVAVSEGLETKWIRDSDAIGAVDLLFKPFNIERVLTAVRAAVTGAARVAASDSNIAETRQTLRVKILVMTRDQSFTHGIAQGFADRGYVVEIVASAAEALERADQTSFDAFVYDAYPLSPGDRFFAGQLRGRPGMGLVPILYLVPSDAQSSISGLDADRSAVRLRSDSTVVLAETLNRLLADTRLGRSFIRYPTVFPLELRYAGRVFDGEAMDIARGGLMLRCEQMPPVGEEVSVAMRFANSPFPVEANGRVIRVDLPLVENGPPGIGVSFERFAGRGEAQLIQYLATLDREAQPIKTMIMQAASTR
ncbi:MAG: protein kinase [Clostridia bacterium]|nr:protein kinase [Deltaproteobacteria bacterium]